MYVDYDFYQNNYGGRVSPLEFPRLEIQASNIVNFYTFNRIKEVDDSIRFAVCELVDYLKEVKDKGGKEIASEKVGTHSVTYVVGTKEGIDPIEKRKKDIVNKYLGHTGLMYRGI